MRAGGFGLRLLLALTLASLASAGGTRLAAQVSPGPLAKAHVELEGTLKCTQCHGGGKEAMPGKCIACHKDIGWLAERGRGLHGARETRGTPCAACHPDHAGEGFALIKWPDGSAEQFDHRRAGWTLEKSHARIDCDKCHTAKFRVSPAAALAAKPATVGWTGLETACSTCHEDIHRGALGADCTKCHDAGKWNVMPGFSHDSTRYPLRDRHATVECNKCHLAPSLNPKRDTAGHLIPVYRPVPHESCTSCHQDAHAGRLGPTCGNCHTPRGWKEIARDRFEHDRTRYPLRGSHASVSCSACHRDFSTEALKKPGFATCGACHRDAHGGAATLAGQVVDCAACHAVAGFSPSTYTVAQHRQARYPLEGRHAQIQCATCHRVERDPARAAQWGTSKIVLRPVFARCLDCHSDDHGGQLVARPGGAECANCHGVQGWKPSRFERTSHAKLRLALEGRHADVPCRACHGSDRKGLPPMLNAGQLGRAGFLFQVTELACTACHVDPHQGRFVVGGARAKATGCLACHDTRTFRPTTADLAAHREFGFVLDGAHRATACAGCHGEMKRSTPPAPASRSSLVAAGTRFDPMRFEAKTACADCHDNVHGDQFAGRRNGGRCDGCHGTDGFRPASRFDHDRDASFKLRGGHENVACSRCHHADGKTGTPGRLIYRPVSGKCASCHAKEQS